MLILFVFLSFGLTAQAQEAQIRYLPYKPHAALKALERPLTVEMWEMQNQAIRNNLELRLNTIPIVNRPNFQLELGLGQVLIRLPI